MDAWDPLPKQFKLVHLGTPVPYYLFMCGRPQMKCFLGEENMFFWFLTHLVCAEITLSNHEFYLVLNAVVIGDCELKYTYSRMSSRPLDLRVQSKFH